jgi:hypothetical protein
MSWIYGKAFKSERTKRRRTKARDWKLTWRPKRRRVNGRLVRMAVRP